MSDTPLTDAFAKQMYSSGIDSHHDGRKAIEFARSLERANAELEAERDRLLAILKDPNAVRVNMLRGQIAWTQETLRHVLGDDGDANAELRKELDHCMSYMRHLKNCASQLEGKNWGQCDCGMVEVWKSAKKAVSDSKGNSK